MGHGVDLGGYGTAKGQCVYPIRTSVSNQQRMRAAAQQRAGAC